MINGYRSKLPKLSPCTKISAFYRLPPDKGKEYSTCKDVQKHDRADIPVTGYRLIEG